MKVVKREMSKGKRNVQWIVKREIGCVCTILKNVIF